MLIVLDDAKDDAQVRALLPDSASCVVVVTSPHRLSRWPRLPTTLRSDLEGFHPSESIELLSRVSVSSGWPLSGKMPWLWPRHVGSCRWLYGSSPSGWPPGPDGPSAA
ncbi:hypothetical protein [Streptomyces varsoviensis]|uniref:hypothetical protein n=1 Tax=Streptomyces varsoviensis TaxID=67373 RepID=UPI0012FE8E7C|nr:hypothetical protein [Streptomyces varsoviensis]